MRESILHGLVREPEHPIPGGNQQRLAFGIMPLLLVMHSPIEIDRKASFDAAEVDNDRAD